MRLLILGGTSEAIALGRALATDPRFQAAMSLAGQTRHPAPQPLPLHRGGFGGAEGLAQYLARERIDALIDATHPFATRISGNAVAAARTTGTRLLTLLRPEWHPTPGDRWTSVGTMEEAAQTLGATPRRVLLTIGRRDLAPFAAAPWHHYVVRSVDPPRPDILPPDACVVTARGPFDEAGEHRLLLERRIDVLVTKNAGGDATVAKLHAARSLGLPVVMVMRPPKPVGDIAASVPAALTWLHGWLPPRAA
jgi:precorrin-6A/cobalt-precorrin-6A reductase